MIPADDLVELVRAYNPKTNEKLIREAYDFGLAMHEGPVPPFWRALLLPIPSKSQRS